METKNDTKTVTASSNPQLANKLVAEAMSSVEQEAMVQAPTSSVPLPPDTTVKLPGGLLDPFDGLTDTAEIRELKGSDEEAISKISDTGKALLTILERATVKIGDKPANSETLDSLLAGDREMLLLSIRKVTFGNTVTLGPGACPLCQQEQTFVVDLDKDVTVKSVTNEDRYFTVDCKVGKVEVSLPTGVTQKNIVTSSNKTLAELDTILLKGCIMSINGAPVMSIDQVRNLSIMDRRAILDAIITRNPGPQLGDIKKPCSACGQEVPLPLTLADLFRE